MKTEHAFPFKHDICQTTIGQTENRGMTLQDYFAAHIMQGMFSNPNFSANNYWAIARWAYQAADVAIQVRNETNE